jgi:putative ABC transport system permease protein
MISVALAVFLFSALRAVLDGFRRGVGRQFLDPPGHDRSTSMIFSMPTSHAEMIKSTPDVQDITWANWFGGIYKDPKNFFGQFAVDPESYLRMYPEIVLTDADRQAFLADRTGCIVGDGLAKKHGFKVGDKLTLQVGIPVYAARLRLQHPGHLQGERRGRQQSMMFHWRVRRRALDRRQIGWVVLRSAARSGDAGGVRMTRSSPTHRARQDADRAGVLGVVRLVLGNLNLLLGSVAPPVVLTTLFVAGNTMAMSMRANDRDRGHADAGIPGSHDLRWWSAKSWSSRSSAARPERRWRALSSTASTGLTGGFIPPSASTTERVVIGLSLLIGLLAAVIPATMASRRS